MVSYTTNENFGTSSFVACAFIGNNMKQAVLGLLDKNNTVRLEACTFQNNTVLQHHLWQTTGCDDSSRFYSDSALNVWCEETGTTSQTQPLAAVPTGTGTLTAEDPFLTGLQQVCAGTLMSSLHGATRFTSLSCAHLASTAWQAMLLGT
jgi:hypothetical protein